MKLGPRNLEIVAHLAGDSTTTTVFPADADVTPLLTRLLSLVVVAEVFALAGLGVARVFRILSSGESRVTSAAFTPLTGRPRWRSCSLSCGTVMALMSGTELAMRTAVRPNSSGERAWSK